MAFVGKKFPNLNVDAMNDMGDTFKVNVLEEALNNKKKVVKVVKISKRNSFYKGMLLTALNLLTIPYYSGLNIMWNASGWIKFQAWDIVIFVLAAGCGTFSVLYMYTIYFNKLENKTNRFSKNSNYFLSVLMLVLLAITIYRILN